MYQLGIKLMCNVTICLCVSILLWMPRKTLNYSSFISEILFAGSIWRVWVQFTRFIQSLVCMCIFWKSFVLVTFTSHHIFVVVLLYRNESLWVAHMNLILCIRILLYPASFEYAFIIWKPFVFDKDYSAKLNRFEVPGFLFTQKNTNLKEVEEVPVLEKGFMTIWVVSQPHTHSLSPSRRVRSVKIVS